MSELNAYDIKPELYPGMVEIGSLQSDPADVETNLEYVLRRGYAAMGLSPMLSNVMLAKLAEYIDTLTRRRLRK